MPVPVPDYVKRETVVSECVVSSMASDLGASLVRPRSMSLGAARRATAPARTVPVGPRQTTELRQVAVAVAADLPREPPYPGQGSTLVSPGHRPFCRRPLATHTVRTKDNRTRILR